MADERAKRRPFSPFDDPGVEEFCRARAAGQSITASGSTACIDRVRALRISKDPDVVDRIRELRSGATELVTVSVGWVLGELQRNASAASKQGQFKASNEALKMLYDIVKSNKDLGAGMRVQPGSSFAAMRKQVQDELSQPLLPETTVSPLDVLEADGVEVDA